MKRGILAATLLVAALCYPSLARAEIVYIGLHLGGQYLDIDAMSGGQIFDQAVNEASADITGMGDFQPEPTHYSAENSFVYGAYAGLSLGRFFRIGARFTHSMMDARAENGTDGADINFDLNFLTILGEVQFGFTFIRILRPFVGIGLGYAFLKSETKIVHGAQSGTSELGTSCFDALATLGLDINIGRWFALGAAAHFSFIGFYYDDPNDPSNSEAAWGFATDYMIRATFRI